MRVILVLVFTSLAVADVPVKKVCDVCACNGDKVDCSSRSLTTNLVDHEWPKTPMSVVTFENNEITVVKPFGNLTIVNLSFRNNKIAKVENQAFKQLYNLTELDLSHNLLTRENFMPQALEGRFTPVTYEPLEKLRVLNLSSNKFESMNQDLFEHVEDLKTLILSNNPFTEFDHDSTIAINAIPYLETLDLSHCKLKNLNTMTFHRLTNLTTLDISWNEFEKLPDVLQQSSLLQTVILDGNWIEFLGNDNSFAPLPKLRELRMNNMSRLMAIDQGALSNLGNLTVLKIANCPLLTEISDSALAKQHKGSSTTWPELKILDLSNNALSYLPMNLLAQWDKLEELHVVNNQWTCDCNNQFFIGTLLVEHGNRLMKNETNELTCSAPPEHLNKTLISLSNRKLRCLDIFGARPERDAAILVGMLIGVLLAVPIVLVFFVLWRRGFFFCGPQGPASFSRAFYRRAPPYDDDV